MITKNTRYGQGVEQYQARLIAVRERVNAASVAAGRDPSEVSILVATKTQSVETIRTVFALPEASGMLRGENRVQELVAKGPDLVDLQARTELIGPLQSNKINAALRWVNGVSSVASRELAQAMAKRLDPARVLPVMVQVNVSGEETKSGVAPAEAMAVASYCAELPNLAFRGFMTIGAHSDDEAVVRRGYAKLASLRDRAESLGIGEALHLSMGMSNDLEWAIAEGATIVRVGTAVFGPRDAVR